MGKKPTLLLALDPSLRGTGWVVVNLAHGCVIAAGVVVTKPPSKEDKKRMTAAEAHGRAGLAISRAVRTVLEFYKPAIVLQEGNAGSKSVSAAAGLARAQQACLDAIDVHLGALPIFATQQAVKKAATGKLSASKDEVEAAMRKRWSTTSDFDTLLMTPPPYAEQGQRLPARGKWENAFDAAAVAHCLWDDPAVAAMRAIAA
jgi:Holliday junction resolvasome RuvABC endonuclease subunit